MGFTVPSLGLRVLGFRILLGRILIAGPEDELDEVACDDGGGERDGRRVGVKD